MSRVLANLAKMTTSTTGTGTITLGSAVSGFLTFAQAGVSNGDIVSYGILDGSNSEVGYGTYTSSGTTLSRTVINSTNSNAAINLSGSAVVFVTALADDFGKWELITTQSPTSTDVVSITGLGAYRELFVQMRAIELASSGNRYWTVSDDNGSTYKTAIYDYVNQNGVISNLFYGPLHFTATADPLSNNIWFNLWNTTAAYKWAEMATTVSFQIADANKLNALRLFGRDGTGSTPINFIGGTFYVWGKK